VSFFALPARLLFLLAFFVLFTLGWRARSFLAGFACGAFDHWRGWLFHFFVVY
jgi:hypothetical protein